MALKSSDLSASLTTEFVCLTVELTGDSGGELRHRIETHLQQYGQPLRWAITSVKGTQAHIEAVVTISPSQA